MPLHNKYRRRAILPNLKVYVLVELLPCICRNASIGPACVHSVRSLWIFWPFGGCTFVTATSNDLTPPRQKLVAKFFFGRFEERLKFRGNIKIPRTPKIEER